MSREVDAMCGKSVVVEHSAMWWTGVVWCGVAAILVAKLLVLSCFKWLVVHTIVADINTPWMCRCADKNTYFSETIALLACLEYFVSSKLAR